MKTFAKFFRNLPIRFKLLLVYSPILVAAALLAGVVIYSQIRNTIEVNIESELRNTTATILNMVYIVKGGSSALRDTPLSLMLW